MDKVKNISSLLFTRSDCRPDTLAPSHAGIAAGALRNPPVNYGITNLTLSAVIRRLNSRSCQKTKICFRGFALKPAGQFFSKFMIRRPSHSAHKPFLNLIHSPCKSGISQFIAAMQCLKQLFEPVQQLSAPLSQLIERLQCVYDDL